MLSGRPLQVIDFAEHDALLRRFNIDYKLLNELQDNNKKQALKKLFDDLQYLITVMGEKESAYALMSWADVFFAEQALDVEKFFAAHHLFANAVTKHANNTMTMVYLGMNAVAFLLSVLALPSVNVNMGQTGNAVGSGWNYVDTCGGMILGITQVLQGEIGMGVANLANSLQLAGCTLAADLGQWCSASVHLSSAAICGLMGFSFAAGMFVSGALEFYEVYKAEKRIEKLALQKAQFINAVPGSSEHTKTMALQKAIYIEKAQRANHLRSAASWTVGGVAMTLTAVAAYAALSGATLGALPIATAVFAGAALVTGLIRKWWVGRVDHVANVKASLIKPSGAESLFDRLQKCIDMPEFNHELTRPGISMFGQVTIKLKDYLENMLLENPQKLEYLLTAYEKHHDVHEMLGALTPNSKIKMAKSVDKTVDLPLTTLKLSKT